MILPDVNLLIYAANADAPMHRGARAWLENTLSGHEPVGLCWAVLLAFVRLTTRPGLFRTPLPPDAAFAAIAEWLEQPGVQILHPGPRHLSILRGLLEPLGTAGNLTSDAHLAALAIEHNALLCSSDGDFARFAGLRWKNPLA
jgi:toxin-antitoxin system PIN domain toxin